MKQYTASFLSILSNFVGVYQELTTDAKTKTKILVAGDVKALEKLVAREQELVTVAGKIEQQRSVLMDEWCAHAGWGKQDITMQYVIDQLTGEDKDLAKQKFQILNQLIVELQVVNKTNSELLENALHFVNYSLELMAGVDGSDMTYGANGALGNRQAYKVLDKKA